MFLRSFTKTAVTMLAATLVSALLVVGCNDDNGGDVIGETMHTVTVSSEGTGASGGGRYSGGEIVNIRAGTVEKNCL